MRVELSRLTIQMMHPATIQCLHLCASQLKRCVTDIAVLTHHVDRSSVLAQWYDTVSQTQILQNRAQHRLNELHLKICAIISLCTRLDLRSGYSILSAIILRNYRANLFSLYHYTLRYNPQSWLAGTSSEPVNCTSAITPRWSVTHGFSKPSSTICLRSSSPSARTSPPHLSNLTSFTPPQK